MFVWENEKAGNLEGPEGAPATQTNRNAVKRPFTEHGIIGLGVQELANKTFSGSTTMPCQLHCN